MTAMSLTVDQIVQETSQWPADVVDSGKETLVPGDEVSARIRKIVGR